MKKIHKLKHIKFKNMEKIIKNTNFLPTNNAILINFNEILIPYNDELYNIDTFSFKIIYKNNILIKAKTIYDNLEKYYRIHDYFILFYLTLFKNLSKNDSLLISIHNNRIVPKNIYSLECIKKGINIKCKNYIYNLFICLFSEILYIGSNDIEIVKHILKKITLNINIDIINDSYLYYKDFKIIYKKLL